MEEITIDINCDVGEGVGNEQQLFPVISSCNIACGGHAGDETTMVSLIRLAIKHRVKIGAHPSYPDRENFGRKSLKLEPESLIASIQDQLDLFTALLGSEEGKLHHIKPHGALYNDIARNPQLASVFLKAIEPYLNDVKLYVPFGSEIAGQAQERNIPIVFEGFADRNYNEDLSLVSRDQPEALITDPVGVFQHVLQMIRDERVTAITGSLVPIKVGTFCVHGDTPTALQILMYLVAELPKERIEIAK